MCTVVRLKVVMCFQISSFSCLDKNEKLKTLALVTVPCSGEQHHHGRKRGSQRDPGLASDGNNHQEKQAGLRDPHGKFQRRFRLHRLDKHGVKLTHIRRASYTAVHPSTNYCSCRVYNYCCCCRVESRSQFVALVRRISICNMRSTGSPPPNRAMVFELRE